MPLPLPVRSLAIALAVMIPTFAPAQEKSPWDSHFTARSNIIRFQAKTSGLWQTLLVGDSNTESFWWNEAGACKIVNAGLAGARVSDVADRLEFIVGVTRPSVAHIMLGTNDVPLVGKIDGYEAKLETDFKRVIRAFHRNETAIYLWLIPPVGKNFADPESVNVINEIIKRVAKTEKVALESQWSTNLHGRADALFDDDVHLTAKANQERMSRIREIGEQSKVRCIPPA